MRSLRGGGEIHLSLLVYGNLQLSFYLFSSSLQNCHQAVDHGISICRPWIIAQILDRNRISQFIIGKKLSIAVIDIASRSRRSNHFFRSLHIGLLIFISVDNLQVKQLSNEPCVHQSENHCQSKQTGGKKLF